MRHAPAVRQNPERYRGMAFWNLLLAELSDQAYQLVRDAVGYETIVNNWSAAEAIPFLLADFAPDSTYNRLKKGFESLHKGAKVINFSLGGPHDPTEELLIRRAIDRGVIVVAAMGNRPERRRTGSGAGASGSRRLCRTATY